MDFCGNRTSDGKMIGGTSNNNNNDAVMDDNNKINKNTKEVSAQTKSSKKHIVYKKGRLRRFFPSPTLSHLLGLKTIQRDVNEGKDDDDDDDNNNCSDDDANNSNRTINTSTTTTSLKDGATNKKRRNMKLSFM